MERRIDDIIIGKRIRNEMGDLRSLKESMKKYGLLNPIVITTDNQLIAGHRRLLAARELGWATIKVQVLPHEDEADLIEIEIDENLHRKPFTEDERTDAFLQLERLRNPSFWQRILNKIIGWIKAIKLRIFGQKKKGRK